MATLVFTAIGTAVGGPLGGAIGSLIGNQLDRALVGGGKREGPRLKELSVSTSSYGTPVPRHFGTMRTAGTIIWATDLVESSATTGGGKGQPSTKTYSYSASLAVALASRPIARLGRVWADGNLLRGAAGDLKTGGTLRVYSGYGDQQPDPLIASDRGGACPAFRGLAYCVFESLQLADFGNRIPALTFEVIADDGEVTMTELAAPLAEPLAIDRPIAGLFGFTDEGGPLADALAAIDQLYPLACDAAGGALTIRAADDMPADPPLLPDPAIDESEDSFGAAAGATARRRADASAIPDTVRYYDTARDYQAGVQRADGRARPGRGHALEFPGALAAGTARALVNAAAERAAWSRETLAWRLAELDPALGPGQAVRLPDRPGRWRIDSWEWRDKGIELELRRIPPMAARLTPADPGEVLAKPDLVVTPTALSAFELPWNGQGSGDVRQAFAAASSTTAGWTGAALYLDQAGQLVPLGASGSRRSVIGQLAGPLAPSATVLLERQVWVEVDLLSADFQLTGASVEALAQGANRALVGDEVIQFASASRVDGPRWRLGGLLRGRGGTEPAALGGWYAGTPFVLLDGTAVALDPAILGRGTGATIAAIGLADSDAVVAPLLGAGATTRPLTPVHPTFASTPGGSVTLGWTRRARGAWGWLDGIDVPLNEQAESYLVGVGSGDAPSTMWEVGEPRLELSAESWAALVAQFPGEPLWVRQIGTYAASLSLLLTTLS